MYVRPQHGWYDRGVTRKDRSRARLSLVTAGSVVLFTVAACSAVSPESAVTVGPAQELAAGTTPATVAPGATPAPAAGTNPSTAGGQAAPPVPAGSALLPIFFVRDGKLGVARRALPADAKIVDSALGALCKGPRRPRPRPG